jgi:hypothetical protein
MSESTADGRFSVDHPDRAAAVLGVLFGILLLPLQLLSSQLYIVTIPPLLLAASLLYLLARRRDSHQVVGVLPASAGAMMAGGVLFGSGALVAVAVATGGRSVPFFALAAVVGSLLLGQILLVSDDGLRPGMVLLEVLAFALAVRVAALVTTPGLVGVDSWTHLTNYAASIRASGSLSAISDVKYYSAPLYHVLVVLFAEAVGTSLRTALYLSLGLTMPLVGLFVYGAARHVLPVRWALFAFAVYTLGDHVVRWGIHIIPTSLGLLFFLALLYCVTALFYTEARWPLYAVVVLLSVAIVLTHQVSSFILAVVVGGAALGQALTRFLPVGTADGWFGGHSQPVNMAALFGFEVALILVAWSQTPFRDGSFLTEIAGNLQRALVRDVGFLNLAGESSGGGASVGSGVPTTVAAIDSLGFFLLLFVTFLGGLAVLHRRAIGQPALAYGMITVTLLAITLGLPAMGIRSFIPGRWYGFMYAPMAILGAAGCLFVFRRLPRRATIAGIVIIATLLPGAMLVAHKGTPDQPVFDEHYQRFAYTNDELAAVDTVRAQPTEHTVNTDHPYRTVFERTNAASVLLLPANGSAEPGEPVVYRRYQSTGAPIFDVGSDPVKTQRSPRQVCPADRDRVYANSDVLICTEPR